MFMFHLLGLRDDNEDCPIIILRVVVVLLLLEELEWQLVKDPVSGGEEKLTEIIIRPRKKAGGERERTSGNV